jgi:uncharacterized membrane protein YfcA
MGWIEVINPLYSISGFAVGALVGVTGVGGGSLMTPLLVLVFGVSPTTAVGTDLLYASITKGGGILAHAWNRTLDWRVVGRLAAGSVPAATFTLLAVYLLGAASQRSSAFISTALGAALLLTAVALLWRNKILEVAARRVGKLDARGTILLTIGTGAVLGVLVSLSSVGAGALGITALIFLYPRLGAVRIVGSDIAHAVPLTLVAGIGYWLMGSIDWQILASLLLGSLPGIFLGSHLALRVPDGVLRPILAAVLILVGLKLLA